MPERDVRTKLGSDYGRACEESESGHGTMGALKC